MFHFGLSCNVSFWIELLCAYLAVEVQANKTALRSQDEATKDAKRLAHDLVLVHAHDLIADVDSSLALRGPATHNRLHHHAAVALLLEEYPDPRLHCVVKFGVVRLRSPSSWRFGGLKEMEVVGLGGLGVSDGWRVGRGCSGNVPVRGF